MKKKKKKTPILDLTLLHEDFIVEILLRLPVRSLLRFKSVCKSWRSLISDPQFAKSHFDLAAAPTHRLLLLPTESVIESLDLDASLEDDSAVVRLDLKVPLNRSVEIIWGSCRGFIVFTLHSDIYVWNPSTSTRIQIPLSQLQNSEHLNYFDRFIPKGFGRGFGYDESRDDYLIVHLELDRHNNPVGNYCLPRVEVFSLKTNTSYFICGASDVGYKWLTHELFSNGLFLNQSLHWLVKSKANELPLIIAFDLINRSLSEILLPYDKIREDTFYFLNIIGGCLSVCPLSQNPLWYMKEYKVHSSWTQSFIPPRDDISNKLLAPIYLTEGVNLLVAGRPGLIKFNEKGELIERRECSDTGICGMLLQHYNIYRESLLSLPGCFAKVEEEATHNEKSIEDRVVRQDEETAEDD